MQSPLASFFAPAVSGASTTASKPGTLTLGNAQFGSAGMEGSGPVCESFFDLLMMAGIEQGAATAPLHESEITGGSNKSDGIDNMMLLPDGTATLAANDLQFGLIPNAQIMAIGMVPSQSSMLHTGQLGEKSIAERESTTPFGFGNGLNSFVPASITNLSESEVLMSKSMPVFGQLAGKLASSAKSFSPAATGIRELSKSSFLSTEKASIAETSYTLNIDNQLVSSLNQPSALIDTQVANQTEQLLKLNNASAIQITTETESANDTAISAGQILLIDVETVANNHTSIGSPIVLPIAEKPVARKSVEQSGSHPESELSSTIETPSGHVEPIKVATGKNNSGEMSEHYSGEQSESADSSETDTKLATDLHGEKIALEKENNTINSTLPNSSGYVQSESLNSTQNSDSGTKTDQVRFVLPNLTHASAKTGTRIVIDLEPRSLGPAELRLSIRNEVVHAELRVNSNEAKQAVEANLDQLQKSFERAGVTVSKVDVSLNNQSDARQFSQQQGWNRPQFKINHQRFTLDEAPEGVASPIAPSSLMASTLIRPQPGRSWTA